MYSPNPIHHLQYVTQASLNSEFSITSTDCHTKTWGFYLPYYLSIAGRRKDEFMPLQRELARSEMPTASSRI